MKQTKRPLEPKDVVRILHPQCPNETGVISRMQGNMISVFRTKRSGFATWFFPKDLKRIGRVK